jgi:predicted ribosome quality control (RQC) complex YloA/Tae2 family protein
VPKLSREQINEAVRHGNSIIWNDEHGNQKIYQSGREIEVNQIQMSHEPPISNPLLEFLASTTKTTNEYENESFESSEFESKESKESKERSEKRDYEYEIAQLEKRLAKLEREHRELLLNASDNERRELLIKQRQKIHLLAARKDIS